MAQLSSLEATNQVSDRVGQMVTNQQQLGAVALVGRDVEYTDSTGSTVQGKVSSLRLGGDSRCCGSMIRMCRSIKFRRFFR